MDFLPTRTLTVLVCILLAASSAIAAPSVGEAAPDFALRSVDGVNLRLSEYRPQVVVLNFWASWCGKCKSASPVLNSLFEQQRINGLQVLAIDVDGEPGKAKDFALSTGITFPVMLDRDTSSVSRLYDLGSVPMTVVIDREGTVRYVHKRFNSESGKKIAAEVAELLAE